jgi:hypothetical protein
MSSVSPFRNFQKHRRIKSRPALPFWRSCSARSYPLETSSRWTRSAAAHGRSAAAVREARVIDVANVLEDCKNSTRQVTVSSPSRVHHRRRPLACRRLRDASAPALSEERYAGVRRRQIHATVSALGGRVQKLGSRCFRARLKGAFPLFGRQMGRTGGSAPCPALTRDTTPEGSRRINLARRRIRNERVRVHWTNSGLQSAARPVI